MSKADELKMDIDDLNSLLNQANRQKSKDLISLEIRRLQTELSSLENIETNTVRASHPNQTNQSKIYEIKLNNYAWDQTDKFVKIYVTLKNIHTLPNEFIICDFTERSMDLRVLGLDNKNYNLPINNLCEKIDIEKSSFKVKTDMIVILLAKMSPISWSHVTGVEKRIKEAKSRPNPEDLSDPEAGLMNLMKKMYQEGDDEMKKTIARAWCESRDKKASV